MASKHLSNPWGAMWHNASNLGALFTETKKTSRLDLGASFRKGSLFYSRELVF